jgi:chromosome partitioning protein
MTHIIALANQKGGVGKTTTAINLAASLACLGQETLLIDMDPQSNLSSGLGLTRDKNFHTIYEVLLSDLPLKEAVQSTSVESLSVVPSHVDLYGAEVELVNLPERELKLKKALAPLIDSYKYILVDCPPSLNFLTLNALAAASSVIIPMPCEYYALEGLSLLVSTIQQVQSGLNPSLVLEGVVLTMHDPRSNLTQQVSQEVKNHFGDKLFNTVIPRNVRLAEAPSFGKPAFQYDKTSAGALAYMTLAKELYQKKSTPAPADIYAVPAGQI